MARKIRRSDPDSVAKREYMREWRALNPDLHHASQRRWRQKNRAHINEYQNNWRAVRKERRAKRALWSRCWYEAHKHEIAARRRELKLQAQARAGQESRSQSDASSL